MPIVCIALTILLATTSIGVVGTVHTPVYGAEPSFDVPVINVTVQEGDDAMLPCSVENLGDKKVVWTDKWATLLTLEFTRIIDDPRISVERPFTKDWNLHIRKTTYNDRGEYTCQINTKPIKVKKVNLIVLVPSKIINEFSSTDTNVREGATVTLTCNVTGVPPPEVTWYKQPSEGQEAKERLDLDPGVKTLLRSCWYTLKQTEVVVADDYNVPNVIGYISDEMEGIGSSGEVLVIHNVSRYCDGTYECVAYNNVDPAVTRQIKVSVEFPPEVNLNSKRLGQYIGRETILDCEITAYPFGMMVWRFHGEDIKQNMPDKYNVEIYGGNQESKRKTLSLRIRDIQAEDFGDYECYASNSLGGDSETMTLYEYIDRTEKTTPAPNTLVMTTSKLKPIQSIPVSFDTSFGESGRPPWKPGVSEKTPYTGEFGSSLNKGTRQMTSLLSSPLLLGLILFYSEINRCL